MFFLRERKSLHVSDNTGNSRIGGPVAQLSAEKLFHQRVTIALVTVPQIKVEFLNFYKLMQDSCWKGIDRLTFYNIHALQIPIFARVSSKILPIATVSPDVERLRCLSGDKEKFFESLLLA